VAPITRTRRAEIAAIYTAGLLQGLALVTFPAASSVLTSPTDYGLSSAAYGAMFLPQAVAAVAASLASGRLGLRTGRKRVLLEGLALDVLAMGLLVTSQAGMGEALGYVMLLFATGSLGAGFGLTVPTLNTYAAAFFPAGVDRAVLLLNALLGLGTALAPVLAALFLDLGAWWALPSLVGVLLLGLLAASARLPLAGGGTARTGAGPDEPAARGPHGRRLPGRAWLYIGFALLYGIVETVNGNWATVYMGADLGASASVASLALAAFWGMVTLGRLLFAALERRLPESRTYRFLPLVAASAMLMVALLPTGSVAAGVLAFGLAGLGCSALLPLTISFAQQGLRVLAASVAGILFASYQVGYGVAAFGVGPLESAGIGLAAIYAAAAGVALVLALLSSRVVRGMHEGAPDLAPA
jgi:fucose permease